MTASVSTQELAAASKEKTGTILFWARQGLLESSRQKGRILVFARDESLSRIRYIRGRQSGTELCRLKEIKDEIKRGLHRDSAAHSAVGE